MNQEFHCGCLQPKEKGRLCFCLGIGLSHYSTETPCRAQQSRDVVEQGKELFSVIRSLPDKEFYAFNKRAQEGQ